MRSWGSLAVVLFFASNALGFLPPMALRRLPLYRWKAPHASALRCFARNKRKSTQADSWDALMLKAQSYLLEQIKRGSTNHSPAALEDLWREVHPWMTEKVRSGRNPSHAEWSLLGMFLKAFSEIPDLGSASIHEVLNTMLLSKRTLSDGHVHNLVGFYVLRGEQPSAVDMCLRLRQNGLKPKPATLSLLLTSFIEEKKNIVNYEEAKRCWRMLCIPALRELMRSESQKQLTNVHLLLDMIEVTIFALKYNCISMESFVQEFDALMTVYARFYSSFPENIAKVLTEILEEHKDTISASSQKLSMEGSFVKLSPQGTCPVCSQKMPLVTLGMQERAVLRSSILKIAALKGITKLQAVANFSRWMRNNAKKGVRFDYVLDGPNVAYTRQNFANGRFNVIQIALVKRHLEEMGARVLVLLPQSYCSNIVPNSVRRHDKTGKGAALIALDDQELQLLKAWHDSGHLYVVDSGTHDDYLWMLATVADEQDAIRANLLRNRENSFSGNETFLNENFLFGDMFSSMRKGGAQSTSTESGTMSSEYMEYAMHDGDCDQAPLKRNLTRVVSNDLMRNHRLLLLNNRDFLRWRYSQVVHFDLSHGVEDDAPLPEVVVFEPPPFSREIHRGPSSWHIPLSPGKSVFLPDTEEASSKHLWTPLMKEDTKSKNERSDAEFDGEGENRDESVNNEKENVDEEDGTQAQRLSLVANYEAMRHVMRQDWLCLTIKQR